MKLILHPIHFVIHKFSHMKLSYLLLERKIGLNLLDGEDFTLPYVIYTIQNSPDGRQLMTQVKKNVWIIDMNWEEPITSQGALDEINLHQTPHGKYKVNISLCRSNIYHRKDLEEVRYIFYQVIPLVSHLEVRLPENPLIPKNIVEGLKGPQRQ